MNRPHAGELLLAWISAHQEGTIITLTHRVLWLAKVNDLPVDASGARRVIRFLSALGYLELNWEGGRWRVMTPSVVLLPDSDGIAMITGALDPQSLETPVVEPVLAEPLVRGEGALGALLPLMRTLQVDDAREFAVEVSASGLQWAGSAAQRLATSLSEVALGVLTAPPAYRSPLEELVATRPRRWRLASSREPERAPGLYRRSGLGRPVYIYKRDGRWWKTDLAVGLTLHLNAQDDRFLSWTPENGRGRNHVGHLAVARGAMLPPQQERAAALCSGTAPSQRDGALVFSNVPRTVAARIAGSLHQDLIHSKER